MFNFYSELPPVIAQGLITALVQAIIVWLVSRLWQKVSNKRPTYGVGPLGNRNFVILSIISLVCICAFFLLFYVWPDAPKNNSIVVVLITAAIISALLLRELSFFWRFGFNYIERSISKDTYKRAFRTCTEKFVILGTNAYSFVDYDEFEEMLKRIRENHGSAKLLLAHPNSDGLIQAARNRGWRENLYQNQAMYSLGKIYSLREQLAVEIEVKLYNANSIEDLPIFRSMFIDLKQTICAIAVYGRHDHGASLPQFFAKNSPLAKSSHSTIYSVLHRYFCGIWYNTSKPSEKEISEFIKFWKETNSNPSLKSELKP
jgi:hypothetical protein